MRHGRGAGQRQSRDDREDRGERDGRLAGGYAGLAAAVLLVVLSKPVWVTVLGHARPLFPYDQPALFAMPVAFLAAIGVSVLDRSRRASAETEAFDDQWVRGQTGIGAVRATER